MARATIAALLVSMMVPCAVAEARPVAQPFMPAGELADAPAGFVRMCARDMALCTTGVMNPAAPPLPALIASNAVVADPLNGATGTPSRVGHREDSRADADPIRTGFPYPNEVALRGQLAAINSQVNRHVIQKTDMEAMGVGEYWRALPTGNYPVGDCEDIAIEKRLRLTAAGFPADRLFYGIAFLRRGGLHTVLVARMADGDYILDSLSPHILRWDKIRYVWLRQQRPGSPMEWTRVGGRTASGYASTGAPNSTVNPAS